MSSTISCPQCHAKNAIDTSHCFDCGSDLKVQQHGQSALGRQTEKTASLLIPDELISTQLSSWSRHYTPVQENEHELMLKWSSTPTVIEVGLLLVLLSIFGPIGLYALYTFSSDFLSKNALPLLLSLPLMLIVIALVLLALSKLLSTSIADIRAGRDLHFNHATQIISLNGQPLYSFNHIASIHIQEHLLLRDKEKNKKGNEYSYHLSLQTRDDETFFITKNKDEYYITEFGTYLAAFLDVELVQQKHQAFGRLRKWLSKKRSRANKTDATTLNRHTMTHTSTQLLVRQQLLDKVQSQWVAGLWEKSLQDEVHRMLGAEPKYEGRQQVWRVEAIQAGDSAQDILSTASLFTAVKDFSGSMLILGQQGAGKTTTLLGLARDFITAARQDSSWQIPLYLNLSSWTPQYHSLDNWLIDELYTNYQVSRSFTDHWLPVQPFVLLLDGLDELAEEHQSNCISAINQFLNTYQRTRAIICSHPEQHEMLITTLPISETITMLPLTTEQVDGYFVSIGDKLTAVHQTLQTHPALTTLAQVPLFLNLICLTYHSNPPSHLDTNNIAESRNQLLNDFLDQTLTNKPLPGRYTPQKCLRWLSYLANQLQVQSLYHVESMQPEWLPTKGSLRWYKFLTSIYLIVIGLFWAYYAQQLLKYSLILHYSNLLSNFFSAARNAIAQAFLPQLCISIFVVTFAIFSVYILPFLKNYKSLSREDKEIAINRPRAFSWPGLKLFIKEILDGNQYESSQNPNSVYLLRFIHALYRERPILNDTEPNQEIWRIVRDSYRLSNMIVSSLIIAGLFALWAYLLELNWMFEALIWFLVLFPTIPLFPLLSGGAFPKHFILRFVLARSGSLPGRNLIPFLDEMAERNILRKIGRAYQFVHPILQDHLASRLLK